MNSGGAADFSPPRSTARAFLSVPLRPFIHPEFPRLLPRTAGEVGEFLRCTAAGSLGRTGSPRAMQPLLEAMNDPKQDMAAAVVHALMDIGSEKALGRLEEATQDVDCEVRIYAKEAVRRIKADK